MENNKIVTKEMKYRGIGKVFQSKQVFPNLALIEEQRNCDELDSKRWKLRVVVSSF